MFDNVELGKDHRYFRGLRVLTTRLVSSPCIGEVLYTWKMPFHSEICAFMWSY